MSSYLLYRAQAPLLTHNISDLRRKSLPFSALSPGLLGIPRTEHRATTLVPLSFPLTEPSDLLEHPLLGAGATLTAARTRLTGVVLRTSTSQSEQHVRPKIGEGKS